MSTATQALRPLILDTPLGRDVLLIQSFTGAEAISDLFCFQISALHQRIAGAKPLALDALLGKGVSVTLQLHSGARYFHGLVSRFGRSGCDLRYDFYYFDVVPWLWLLTQTANCRIFQDLTVPEIVKKVFQDHGLTDFRDALTKSYTKWDYCVQYHETDFNFVSRLLEQEGIFYFFEHERSKHTLVLADSPQAHQPCPGQQTARYVPEGGRGEEEDVVTTWQMEQSIGPGKYSLRDYHFEMPEKTLDARQNTALKAGGNDKLEMYDYPGEYAQRFNKPSQRLGSVEPEATRTVKLRMEEQDAGQVVVTGTSTCRAFTTGYRFELTHPPPGVTGGPYVLTSIQHSADQGDYTSESSVWSYTNSFSGGLHRIPIRPARMTSKPVIQGPQTAVVVGIEGEEIYTDKFGRVKVQFHWDREGKKNENSSCWVRVAQPLAGKRWGASFWPRIGQEVVVDFLEGDPEMPLITGSVYNAEQMPPYLGDGFDSKHKDDNRVSGIKTNTTLGGEGFNELRFDDTKDKEQVFIHAERNLDLRVKNDAMEHVLDNRHLIVGSEKSGQPVGDQYELVYRDKHLHVRRNQQEQIEGGMKLLVGGDADLVVKKTRKELIEAADHVHVKGNRNEKVDGTQSLTVGASQQEKVGMNHALEAGLEVHIKSGMTLVIEAGLQISLKVGGSFIDINPAGVSIEGPLVNIAGGGSPGSGSGASPTAPDDAQAADPKKPEEADDSVTGSKSAP